MGYYIYHSKATLSKPTDRDPTITNGYVIDDIREGLFDTDVSYFEKYIQLIQVPKVIESVYLDDDKEAVERENGSSSRFFYKNDAAGIRAYVRSKNYDKLLSHRNDYIHGRGVISFYEIEMRHGFYAENVFECSYKDGQPDFYKKYPSGKCFTKFEVFEQACNLHIDGYRQVDILRETAMFKKNLVGNYEPGRSILFYF